jgi:ribosomal-protein-alanine N-acetyltransferase
MSGFTVRQSAPFDLPAILAIERANETAAHWTEDAYRVLWGDPDANRIGFVAEADGKALGFIIGHEIAGEWELENLAVAPGSQRKGIGRALVQRLIAVVEGRHAARLVLEVRESNVAAGALYQSEGFEQIGRRANYYSNPAEDALLFEKKFDDLSMKIR